MTFADIRHRDGVISRYHLPQPRCALGLAGRGLVSACLDISDGLIADAGHLAEASGLACVIEAAAVPLSPAARAVLDDGRLSLADLLTGGDDYELLLAVPPDRAADLEAAAAQSGTSVVAVGRAEEGRGVRLVDGEGRIMPVERAGYEHFG